MLVNTTTRKKDKIRTVLTKIKTIKIRSQNDLISITDILFKLYVRVGFDSISVDAIDVFDLIYKSALKGYRYLSHMF